MKLNRTHLFIGISSLALIVVLIIQVNWILETARVKEEIFNEKANMVLSKTAEALKTDQEICRNLEFCATNSDVKKVDSLFNHYMKLYNIHIRYYFKVTPDTMYNNSISAMQPNVNLNYTKQQGCYTACLQDAPAGRSGLGLKLVFPEKEEFILAEMGVPFIASVVLILVVLIMSWRSTLSLLKEKEISEHTTDFLNNMTHEFKTPLTNIALAGKMMVKDANIHHEEKIKHYSGIILEENEKLIQQVEQVLSMTALERGEIPLQKTGLDVHELILGCVKCIHLQIENKQGHLSLKLEAEHHMVIGDKTHLSNALCNLVDNAIQYCERSPEISIQTHNEHASLVIVISDNGIGIEKTHHEKVFDKFFRVPTGNVHNVKGFGLGLAYTKAVIELHGGSIVLESEVHQGTTFTITLPYV